MKMNSPKKYIFGFQINGVGIVHYRVLLPQHDLKSKPHIYTK